MTADDLRDRLDRGCIPIVLISSYRLNGDRTPHWVAVTAYDDRFLYVNDPFVDVEEGRTETDCIGIPILPQEFDRMMRFGRRKHYASVVVHPKS